jgi:hypothetical protein
VTSSEGKLTLAAVDASGAHAMSGVFQTMIGLTQLREGYYAELRGQSQINVLRGAFDVALDSRACESPVGWVAIDHLFYFSGILTTLDMRFEARCAGFAAPMHGQIRWRE